MKKVFLIVCAALLAFFQPNCVVAKAESSGKSAEEQIKDVSREQINELNLNDLEQAVSDINYEPIFNSKSLPEIIEDIVEGKFSLSFESVATLILDSIKSAFVKMLPFVGVMLGIILLSSIINKLKSQNFASGVSEIIFFASYSVVVLVVSALIASQISNCANIVYRLKNQMSAVFPILLTLMTASGASVSVRMYQPAVAALSGGVSSVFSYILLPIVSVMFVLSAVSNLSDNVKLNKFQDLVSSVFKWVLGAVSTLFMAFLAVKGITASTRDGISVRTAKYAIKNYVPIIGGYISEGFELVVASSIIIKNGVGIMAIVFVLLTVVAPVVSIVILSLSLKLVAALVEPAADKKFCSFLSSCGKILNLLSVVVIGVALMYFLSLALIISTANNLF